MEGHVDIGPCDEAQSSALVYEFVLALDFQRAKNIEYTDDTVFFRGGMFRGVSNMNVLITVTRGQIKIIPGNRAQISYLFLCTQMLISSILFSIVWGVFLLDKESLIMRILGAIGFFCVCFALNYAIGLQRLRKFLRKTAGKEGYSPKLNS